MKIIMPVISIKKNSVGYYEIEHTIEPLKEQNRTLLQERGLLYNLKTRRKQRVLENKNNSGSRQKPQTPL